MKEHSHRCKTCPYFAGVHPEGRGECRRSHPSDKEKWFVGQDFFCGQHPDIQKMISDHLRGD